MDESHGHNSEKSALSRRAFLKGSGAAAAASALATVPTAEAQQQQSTAAPAGMGPGAVKLELTVNGKKLSSQVEPRVTLLDALRNYLDVTGCKRVCDRASCGACTVLL